jgi:hypothetical protein
MPMRSQGARGRPNANTNKGCVPSALLPLRPQDSGRPLQITRVYLDVKVFAPYCPPSGRFRHPSPLFNLARALLQRGSLAPGISHINTHLNYHHDKRLFSFPKPCSQSPSQCDSPLQASSYLEETIDMACCARYFNGTSASVP